MQAQMNAQFGIDMPAYVWALIAWVAVLALSAFSIDVGARVLGVLLVLELLSLVLVGLAVIFRGGGPEGFDLAASFSPGNILAGGLTGSAGIALAFAFASFIGFEATAIYSEESKNPKRTVPAATYGAVIAITVIFTLVAFAVVSALGTSTVIDEVVARSTVDDVPLADAANVIFSIANEYVGGWLGATMAWLVLGSLFTGLLAFQNSIARYFFSMGRAGVLPKRLRRVNRTGAPVAGGIVTSVITAVVIAVFWATGQDPVLQMFYWFSGLAVVAIVLVEILVCLAVVKHFRRDSEVRNPFVTIIAPILAALGLALAEYLLMSRFGLLSGEVAEGVDPTTQTWGLNTLGWILVLLPFAVFVVGTIVGAIRRKGENAAAVADLVS
jgi:amino acid transporter